jgi:cytosol alanyl aminopeptidase
MNRAQTVPAVVLVSLTAAALVGCAPGVGGAHGPPLGTPPPEAAPASGRAPAPAPPALRLPDQARPTSYDVDLTLDPARQDFSGRISIALELRRPADHLWLNAHEIAVDAAWLSLGRERLPAWASPAGKDYLLVRFPTAVGPGPARLTIDYRGKARRHDGDGIYQVEEAGAHYLYTQFEATDARQAFPCFDEPSYKVPWRLSIRTRAGQVALANTPPVEEIDGQRTGQPGWKTVRFAETRPLPSYLLAFAVGPFEFVDAGKSRSGVPLRIVVPRGRAGEVAYPVEVTGTVLARLEDWFGTSYPFSKLDSIAVPVFNAGAMENPGLITYQQSILVTKPGESTRDGQRRYAEIAAHELAHQWFGNLVTMQFWDDIWLNEAFATWMADKISTRWKPEWGGEVDRVSSRSRVMGQDSLGSARMIRQPIETAGDIANVFDGITYNKGAAVLRMFERWIGEDTFRAGVRAYLARHAWSNAAYPDFVAAISAAAGKDVRPAFDSFVTQTGVPLVSFDLDCAAGRPPVLRLGQRRYRPLGSNLPADRLWQIPVCVRYGSGMRSEGRACTLLTQAQAELPLPDSKTCPEWVQPNEEAYGYYRTLPQGKLLDRLLVRSATVLSLPERIGLLGDTNALVSSGDLGPESALALVERLARDPSHRVVEASLGIVKRVDDMVPAALRPRYERFIQQYYGERARQLGWRSRPGESDDIKELRPDLLGLVAQEGNDRALATEARTLVERWLQDRSAIEPELVSTALVVAAYHGDAALFDKVYAAARATRAGAKGGERQERSRLLSTLAAFRDPALVDRALAIGLSGEFEPREAMVLLQAPFRQAETRARGHSFWKTHYDQIAGRLPEGMRAGPVRSLVSLCDEQYRPDIESFYRPRLSRLAGGPRVINQTLEQLTLCAQARKAQSPGVAAFFSGRSDRGS